jgi:hypothetical protein
VYVKGHDPQIEAHPEGVLAIASLTSSDVALTQPQQQYPTSKVAIGALPI